MAVALLLNAVLLAVLAAVAGYLVTVEDGWSIVAMFLLLAFGGAAAGARAGKRRREPVC